MENPCSDICRPLLRGLHKCMCEGDKYLADDEATCVEGTYIFFLPKSIFDSYFSMFLHIS